VEMLCTGWSFGGVKVLPLLSGFACKVCLQCLSKISVLSLSSVRLSFLTCKTGRIISAEHLTVISQIHLPFLLLASVSNEGLMNVVIYLLVEMKIPYIVIESFLVSPLLSACDFYFESCVDQ
jgi:hypothetical protein